MLSAEALKTLPFDVIFCMPPAEGLTAQYPQSVSGVLEIPEERVIAKAHKVILATHSRLFRLKYASSLASERASVPFVYLCDDKGRDVIVERDIADTDALATFVQTLYHYPSVRETASTRVSIDQVVRRIRTFQIAELYDCPVVKRRELSELARLLHIPLQHGVSDVAECRQPTEAFGVDDRFDAIALMFSELAPHAQMSHAAYDRVSVNNLLFQGLFQFMYYISRNHPGWRDMVAMLPIDVFCELLKLLCSASMRRPIKTPIKISDAIIQSCLECNVNLQPAVVRAADLQRVFDALRPPSSDGKWVKTVLRACVRNEQYSTDEALDFYETMLGF